MTQYHALMGTEMDEAEIDALLTETGVGVLSMSAEGVPYGVPMSFGYDGDALYFVFLGGSSDLRKETYAAQSSVASFAAFDVDPDGSWRSAVVAGPIDRVSAGEWDAAREAMAENAYRATHLTEREFESDPNVWALDARDRSGRAVGGE
jgi:hypothetical protein